MKNIILITGASSGMGKDGALRLIREGHIVYAAARRLHKMQDIIDAGGHAIQLDIIDKASIKEAVDKVISEQKKIDVLWNNAGYALVGAVEDVSEEDAKYQFEVNLFGLAEITKLILPFMRRQMSGTIINTSSIAGKINSPLGAWYHASKHALEGWSDCLRLELKPFNIKVVILEPGGVQTELADAISKPLLARSIDGAYQELSKIVADTYQSTANNPNSVAHASVISDVIVKIIKSSNPKTRYVAGYMSKTAILFRKVLTDRMFDKFVMKVYDNLMEKNKMYINS